MEGVAAVGTGEGVIWQPLLEPINPQPVDITGLLDVSEDIINGELLGTSELAVSLPTWVLICLPYMSVVDVSCTTSLCITLVPEAKAASVLFSSLDTHS